jgi:hypothetical protein
LSHFVGLCRSLFFHTHIHAPIQAYIPTYLRTYVHTYIHTPKNFWQKWQKNWQTKWQTKTEITKTNNQKRTSEKMQKIHIYIYISTISSVWLSVSF